MTETDLQGQPSNHILEDEGCDYQKSKGNFDVDVYYDPRFLHIKSGLATKEQIEQAFDTVLQSLCMPIINHSDHDQKDNVKPLLLQREVNVVMKNGQPSDYSYVWISDPEIAKCFSGYQIQIEDPNWVPPENDSPLQSSAQSSIVSENLKGKSWADIDEEEELEKSRYICPKIHKTIRCDLPRFPYNASQLAILKQREEEGGKVVSINDLPTEGELIATAAFVQDPDPKYSTSILCGRNIPTWATEQHLRNVFAKYASNTKSGKYPTVTITKKRMAFIAYNPKTRDAQFARLMTRKLTLCVGKHRQVLHFDYAYNKER